MEKEDDTIEFMDIIFTKIEFDILLITLGTLIICTIIMLGCLFDVVNC